MVSDKTLETANLKQGPFFIFSYSSEGKPVLERHRIVASVVMNWVNEELKKKTKRSISLERYVPFSWGPLTSLWAGKNAAASQQGGYNGVI